jgi:hypothetical protein
MIAALDPTERRIQLCDLEAMGQVEALGKGFRPDLVVPYAMTPTRIDGSTLIAEGAAVHSGHDWLDLRFRCAMTPDGLRVATFEFAIGQPIPRRLWASHHLPDADGP